MTRRFWGTIRFYSAEGKLINERRYYTSTARFEMILKEHEAAYYHILPEWRERYKTIVPDLPKKITRPPAVYDNAKSLY
jgi:hypothetical protein